MSNFGYGSTGTARGDFLLLLGVFFVDGTLAALLGSLLGFLITLQSKSFGRPYLRNLFLAIPLAAATVAVASVFEMRPVLLPAVVLTMLQGWLRSRHIAAKRA